MSWRSKCLALAAAAFMAAGIGAAAADDVNLVHDKGFWAAALTKVTDAASAKLGFTMKQTAYSPPEQYKAFIQSSVASGDMPDIFTWWTGGVYQDLIKSGSIAELDGIWDELIASGEFSKGIRDFYTVDGHAYGVPLHLSRWVAFYNKKQFADAGIAEMPKTWAELMDVAEKLKAKGITPFVATTQEGWRGFIWFQEIMIRTNPEAYNGLHTGKVAYDSEPVRNAFKIWADMYAKGYFTDPRSNEEVADFAKGKGAIYLMGDWVIGLIKTAGLEPDKDFGAFIMPNADAAMPSSAILEGGPIMLSKTGIAKPDVVKALKYFISVDGANVWAEASGNSLGNSKANPPNALVAALNAETAAKNTIALQRWWEAVPAELQGEIEAEFVRFQLTPTMETAEDVMKKIQALNAAYWAEHQ
jgi:multiple sugar transport system substrate-binding protein